MGDNDYSQCYDFGGNNFLSLNTWYLFSNCTIFFNFDIFYELHSLDIVFVYKFHILSWFLCSTKLWIFVQENKLISFLWFDFTSGE